MSDLQARIGTKQSQERFPNKSWIRPGYDISKSPGRNKHLGKRQRLTGNDSDSSGHDDSVDHSEPRRHPSLFARLGLEEDGEPTEMRARSKSLLERVEYMSPDEEERNVSLFERVAPITSDKEERNIQSLDHLDFTLPETSATRSSSFHHAYEDRQDKGTPFNNNGTATPTVNSQVYNNGRNRLPTPTDTVVEETRQKNGSGTVASQSSQQMPDAQNITNLSSAPAKSAHTRPSDTPQNNTTQPYSPPLLQSMPSQQSSLEEGQVSDRDIQRSPDSDEGELRPEQLPADKVRDLILPLVIQNAAIRARDTERRPSLQPSAVDTGVLSNNTLTSFAAKATQETSRDLRTRAQLPPKPASAMDSNNPSRATDVARLPHKPVTHVQLKDKIAQPSSSSSSSSNAGQPSVFSRTKKLGAEISAQPMANASAFSSYHREPDVSLRYTPDPHESQTGRYEQTYPYSGPVPPPANQPGSSAGASSSKVPTEPRIHHAAARTARAASHSRSPGRHAPLSASRERGVHRHGVGAYRTDAERDRDQTRGRDRERDREAAARSRTPPQRTHQYSQRHHSGAGSESWAGQGTFASPGSLRAPVSPSHNMSTRRQHHESPHRDTDAGRYRGRDRPSPPPAEGYKAYEPGNRRRSYSPHAQRRSPERVSHAPRSPTASFWKERRAGRSRSREHEQDRDRGHKREQGRESEQGREQDKEPPSRPERMADEDMRMLSVSVSPTRNRHKTKEAPRAVPSLPEVTAGNHSTANDKNNRKPVFFAQGGLEHIGVVKWTFEVDREMARTMGLQPRIASENMQISHDTAVPAKEKAFLKLACFPTEGFMKCIHLLQSGQNLTADTSPMNPQWPTQGHLIIKVNEDIPQVRGKTYFPEKLGPNDVPISLEHHIYEGINCIELVQLSNMADKVFLLFSQITPVPSTAATETADTTKLPPLETTPGPINIKLTTVTSGRLH